MPIKELLVATIFCAGFYLGVSFMEIQKLHGAERTKRIQVVILMMMVALVPAAVWIWSIWKE